MIFSNVCASILDLIGVIICIFQQNIVVALLNQDRVYYFSVASVCDVVRIWVS